MRERGRLLGIAATAAAPAVTPPAATPPAAAPAPADDPPPPVRTWDASPEAQTRTLLDVLGTGDFDALATAPIAEPFVLELTPNGEKKPVVRRFTRADLVACLKDTCRTASDVLLSGWQVHGEAVKEDEDVPAPITCKPAKPAGTTCCAIAAVSIADFALVPTRTCATGGKLTRLVVEQDGV